ncbi:MAG: hypothetical protein J6Q48_06315 [Bacteroidaceae bacterium]|nr:hypothetical protein [Bacteroidaceae bacterium]
MFFDIYFDYLTLCSKILFYAIMVKGKKGLPPVSLGMEQKAFPPKCYSGRSRRIPNQHRTELLRFARYDKPRRGNSYNIAKNKN